MPRSRSWSDDDLRAAVRSSQTYADVARALSMHPGSSTVGRLRDRTQALGLDTRHFTRARPREDMFRSGVRYHTGMRDRYLQLMPYECQICGVSKWCGQPLTLQLDHIDGDRMNNTLQNLRLLCPNCHSQTATWSRKKSNSV
ncbi:HNH endonuclease [Gordonia Phage PhinkBoden]|nr:HNH endonuclease [Gordonia Phage PhinkBoden]